MLSNNRSKIGARGFFGCDWRKGAVSPRDSEQTKSPLVPIPLLFRFPYYPYTNSKDKNLCISQTIRGFFCFIVQKIGFIFNKISDLFGIKIGFAKFGLGDSYC